jgi:hypothetical protein
MPNSFGAKIEARTPQVDSSCTVILLQFGLANQQFWRQAQQTAPTSLSPTGDGLFALEHSSGLRFTLFTSYNPTHCALLALAFHTLRLIQRLDSDDLLLRVTSWNDEIRLDNILGVNCFVHSAFHDETTVHWGRISNDDFATSSPFVFRDC